MKMYTEDGRHAVKIMGDEGDYTAVALQCAGRECGGDSWWFYIGRYKTIKGAQRSAKRRMARLGYRLSF
jgi:hypothetical protein